jgi:hypothetical protein
MMAAIMISIRVIFLRPMDAHKKKRANVTDDRPPNRVVDNNLLSGFEIVSPYGLSKLNRVDATLKDVFDRINTLVPGLGSDNPLVSQLLSRHEGRVPPLDYTPKFVMNPKQWPLTHPDIDTRWDRAVREEPVPVREPQGELSKRM